MNEKTPASPPESDGQNGSPLGRFLMRVLRVGTLGAAGFLAFAILAMLWQRHQGDLGFVFQPGDKAFFWIAGIMLLAALWISRSISRELR